MSPKKALPPPEEQNESLLLSLLDNQRQRKDTRVFAHAAAETQVAYKELLNLKSRKFSESTLNGNQESGFLEVFPRVASRPPKLLQELESILVDRLRNNDKAASVLPIGSAKDRDPKLSANLSLDAHRQVLSAFIAGFATYAPLLSRIQDEFERALNLGVFCAQDNVEMRQHMGEEELKRERAAAAVRGEVLAGDLRFRQESLSRLREFSERRAKAEKKKALAEKDLKEAQTEQVRAEQVVAELRRTNERLCALIASEQAWSERPLAASLGALDVGPLSKEDEEFLDSELGISPGDMGGGNMTSATTSATTTNATTTTTNNASSSSSSHANGSSGNATTPGGSMTAGSAGAGAFGANTPTSFRNHANGGGGGGGGGGGSGGLELLGGRSSTPPATAHGDGAQGAFAGTPSSVNGGGSSAD